jgi:predicted nucleic acid-binding protein
VAGELLLDTGALVSLLDRSQAEHTAFRELFETWSGVVLTTEAVLTEATRLLGRVAGGRTACLDFVLAGGAVLVPASVKSTARCRELIAQYADLPMDYAAATLIALAEDVRTNLVATTDRRDFRIYRLASGGGFRVVPEQP